MGSRDRESPSAKLRAARASLPNLSVSGSPPNAKSNSASPEADTRVRTRPGGRSRSTIVLIVQRSTIDLFAAYGVTVAPAGPSMVLSWPPPDAVVATIAVTVAGKPGHLELTTSRALVERANPAQSRTSHLDWGRELANQLAGRVANRFARYRLPMTTTGVANAYGGGAGGPPAARARTEQHAESILRVRFHALRDAVCVTLSGAWDDDEIPLELEAVAVIPEGEVILF